MLQCPEDSAWNIHIFHNKQQDIMSHTSTEYFEHQIKFWHMIWTDTWGGFGTHVPSLYLQVCIINMSVYIQPLSVMKENFLHKEYL